MGCDNLNTNFSRIFTELTATELYNGVVVVVVCVCVGGGGEGG